MTDNLLKDIGMRIRAVRKKNLIKDGLTKYCEDFPVYTKPLFKNKKKTVIDLSTIRMGVFKSDESTSFHQLPNGKYRTKRHY